MCGPVPRCTSWQRRLVSSVTRSPVWIARVSSAWSRRPIQRVAVRRGQERVDLFVGEVGDDRAVEAFGRDGEHAADERGVLGVAERGEAEHRVDRRQARVAGAGAVAALVLEVIEERRDQRCVEILDLELGWLFAGALLREGEQQPEGVAVGGDRVRADALLADQTG